MLGTVSSTSAASTTSASTESSSSDLAQLTAQLAAKQAELAAAKTDEDKAKFTAAISKLKAQITQLQSAEQPSSDASTQQATASADGKTSAARAGASRADRMAPEAKMSGAAMDVLMRLGPQGGMMPPGGRNGAGGPPDISKLYAEIDANDDGKVSKDEFITDASKHMDAEDADKLYAAMDTDSTGSITEEQLAKGLAHGDRRLNRPMDLTGEVVLFGSAAAPHERAS